MITAGIRDDTMKWKHFSYYWTFVTGTHMWLVDSPHKGPVKWRFADLFAASLEKPLNKEPVIWDSLLLMWCPCNEACPMWTDEYHGARDIISLIVLCARLPLWHFSMLPMLIWWSFRCSILVWRGGARVLNTHMSVDIYTSEDSRVIFYAKWIKT